jgi:hypothetical protein
MRQEINRVSGQSPRMLAAARGAKAVYDRIPAAAAICKGVAEA